MVETRRQRLNLQIKEEDSKNELKCTQLLNGISSTTKKTNKINKRNASKNRKTFLPASQVKLEEEESNNKVVSRLAKEKQITTDQIKQLIDYIEKDKLSVRAASKKVKMNSITAHKYYYKYKHDPEKRIPLPTRKNTPITQDQITTVIRSIVDDGISAYAASRKANMDASTALEYYRIYLNSPSHEIPTPRTNTRKSLTQDKIKKLIHYIVDDGMSLKVASIKANISEITGKGYYLRYLKDPDHRIPIPRTRKGDRVKYYTQDHIKELIGYIVDDGMTIIAASTKANMGYATAKRYYSQYLNDPNHNIPVPGEGIQATALKNQVKKLIDLIVNEKYSVSAASKKVKLTYPTALKYYNRYKNDPQHKIPHLNNFSIRYTHEQKIAFVNYINNDKLSTKDAAFRVKMSLVTAKKIEKDSIQKSSSASNVSLKVKQEEESQNINTA